MVKDLTEGNPQTVLWKFCLPLFGSIIFQQLYNIADSLIAGKFIGENALAAVGNSYEITLIFIAFAFGCNIGCSVIVSQLFGAKKYNQMKTAVYTTWIAGAVLCGTLMVLGFLLCPTLLRLIQTPEIVFADSELYLNIYIGGLFFLFFYNIATGIFSALGDSRTPFIFLAISSTANILVDYFFVTSLNMGVAGVAWATFICQGISCVAAMLVVIKKLAGIHTEGSVPKFSLSTLKQVSTVAVPSILQQSFVSVGNIIIQSLINGYGASVMAGYSAAVKLNNLVVTSYGTFGNGISNYSAQNLGAGKNERIQAGFGAGLKMVYIVSVPIVILYLLCGQTFIEFFMNDGSTEAIQTGVIYLRILSPFYFVVATKLVADGILRGVSAMGRFMISTFTDLIIRVGLAALFSNMIGTSTGIWMAWPFGWSIATVLSIIFYRQWIRDNVKDKNVKNEKENA
ncbi:MAG: MATE family efflux transporter [Clostridiales bacterium]|nr:MATE family efflux transporter [Clostridiales bacterium]